MQQRTDIGTALAGRRILLGVSGGIAAYKSAELVRRLRDAGCEIRVAMTEAATRFVTPTTFQALSGHAVRTSLWDEQAEAAMGHIELARWPDAILVAPASADLLARLAHGLADDLLTTLCLASDRPLVLAPAMNRLMWAHPATQANVETLVQRGATLIHPADGAQACGETGPGRMQEPARIVEALAALLGGGPLQGVRAVVSAGPTREPIDPVRAITNRSSGKMGFAVAEALAAAGAEVTLVAGPVHLPTPPGVRRIDVETAAQMLEACIAACAHADLFVGAAAVADYSPAEQADTKIKKQAERMRLELVRTADILCALRERYPSLFIVGFAAETGDPEAAARDKLERKGLQMICANDVSGGKAFDADDNELLVLWPGGATRLARAPKRELARRLVERIAARLAAGRSETTRQEA